MNVVIVPYDLSWTFEKSQFNKRRRPPVSINQWHDCKPIAIELWSTSLLLFVNRFWCNLVLCGNLSFCCWIESNSSLKRFLNKRITTNRIEYNWIYHFWLSKQVIIIHINLRFECYVTFWGWLLGEETGNPFFVMGNHFGGKDGIMM